MGKAKAKTTMNKRAMNRVSGAALEALEMTLDASKDGILGDIMTSEVVPKQTGELERSAFIDDSKAKRGQVTVVYDTPYARRLYWHPEYNFRRDKNRHAQGMWLEAWASGKKDNIIKRTFIKLWKKISGGIIQ